jgi:prophage regulatory protein
MANAISLPEINRILKRPTVEQITADTRSTIYRKIKNGLFVRPVNLGGGRVGWPANEVQAVVNARIAGQGDDQIKALVANLEAARVSQ